MKTSTFIHSLSATCMLAWCATATPCFAREGHGHRRGETYQAAPAAPAVQIVAPGQAAAFLVGTNISLAAWSQNFTDAVAGVEFFAGTNSLGVTTNFFTLGQGFDDPMAQLVWSNAPAGDYSLTAVAMDWAGITATSAPVNISVVTDLPPVVKIDFPRNGSSVYAPTNINLGAFANDPEGLLSGVEFFSGTTSLGVVTSSTTVTNDDGQVRALYSLPWNSPGAGIYTVTAVATDLEGDATTSAPVTFTVTTNLPPHLRFRAGRH